MNGTEDKTLNYLKGRSETKDVITDHEFGISEVNCMKLKR
jgi:hypothetical protein